MNNQKIDLGDSEFTPERKDQKKQLSKAINTIDYIGNLSLNGFPEDSYNIATYVCPICGESHNIDDCVVVNQETERKHLGTTYKGKFGYKTSVYEKHYLVTSYNIRICPKCAKYRSLPYLCTAILIIIGIIGLLIRKRGLDIRNISSTNFTLNIFFRFGKLLHIVLPGIRFRKKTCSFQKTFFLRNVFTKNNIVSPHALENKKWVPLSFIK